MNTRRTRFLLASFVLAALIVAAIAQLAFLSPPVQNVLGGPVDIRHYCAGLIQSANCNGVPLPR